MSGDSKLCPRGLILWTWFEFQWGVGRRGTLGFLPKIYFTLVIFHSWGYLEYSKLLREAKKFKELEFDGFVYLLECFLFIWHPRHSKGWNDSGDLISNVVAPNDFFIVSKIKPSFTLIGLNLIKELCVTIFFQNYKYLNNWVSLKGNWGKTSCLSGCRRLE